MSTRANSHENVRFFVSSSSLCDQQQQQSIYVVARMNTNEETPRSSASVALVLELGYLVVVAAIHGGLSRIVILSKRHLLPIILIQGAIKGSAVAEHLGMALTGRNSS